MRHSGRNRLLCWRPKGLGFFLGLCFFLVLQSGCASHSGLTIEAQKSLNEAREPRLLIQAPFIVQDKDHCGPATLTMALTRLKPEIQLTEVTAMTFTPGAEGSFQNDMLSATRRLGFAPYAVPTFDHMLKTLEQGQPVVVFQNLGFRFWPVWHYALLVGYERDTQNLILHTGDQKASLTPLNVFLKTWERADRWSYVMLPPNQLPQKVSLDEALENAGVFSRRGQRTEAIQLFTAARERFPERFEPDAGLAAEWASQGENAKAITAFQSAIQKQPEHPGLYFNVAVLYLRMKNTKAFQKYKALSLAKAQAEGRDELLARYAEIENPRPDL